MKQKIKIIALLFAAIAAVSFNGIAQQVQLPKTAADVPGPAAGTAMTKEYVQTVGRMAYIFGWPLVNHMNRTEATKMLPEPGLVSGVIPLAYNGLAVLTDYIKADQRFVVCINQDVIYGIGFDDLTNEPMVMQVPDFGKRFYVYGVWDARSDAFAEIGTQYNTKPGFYLVVGPNWKGETPAGINSVIRSSTNMVLIAPRVFVDDNAEDHKAVQPLLSQLGVYPLSKYDGKMKVTDWTKLPKFPGPAGQTGETKWVEPEKYFDQLSAVMKLVPPLPGEEALYNWINSVWEAAAKNAEVKTALVESFIAADKELIAPLLRWENNGRTVGNGWTSPVNNAAWGTDYLNRTATGKSNMYDNTQDATKYIYRDYDAQGKQLSGNNSYTLTFPKGQLPPVKGFWSLTLYNAEHFFHSNPLNRYSLGTKTKTLKYNEDGSLTLYAGSKSPGKDKESNWLPAPDGNFSLYIRAYWADKAILDGTWMPPQVEKVK